MQTQNTEIAVRLYENQKLGTTYGKGLYHSAIFNGTADVPSRQVKYLLDFLPYTKWQHTAKSDMDMEVLHCINERCDDQTLVSWVVRYDLMTKQKERVLGYSVIDVETLHVEMFVYDPKYHIKEEWMLEAKPCRQVQGKNVPTLLAANYDMGYR